MLDVFENSASVPVWTVLSVMLELTIALKLEGKLRTVEKQKLTSVCVWCFPPHSSISSFKKHYLKNVCLFTHNYLVGLKRAIVLLSFVFLLSEVLFVFARNQNNLYNSLSYLFTYIFQKCVDTDCFLLLLNKNQMFLLSCQGSLVHPL